MSETRWTPGDWRASGRTVIAVQNGDTWRIADVVLRDTTRGPSEEVFATARLIAAAPAMAAFVRRAADHFGHDNEPLGIEARAILSKIEGRQP